MNKIRLKKTLRTAFRSSSWRSTLLVMSKDADGFKREKAVQLLGLLSDPTTLPYLIERANDWVPEVRVAARKGILSMIRATTAAAFVCHLPALMHLQLCRRDDHSELIRSVHSFLMREENIEHVVSGLHGPDIQVARIVMRMLAAHRRMSAVELIKTGLSHPDALLRSIASDLLKDADPEGFNDVIEIALRDPYMPVRREAFHQLLERNPSQGLRVARKFLLDSSASIREVAANRLLRAGIYVGTSARRH